MNCLWCEAEFAPRKTGGKAQRFCSSECRTAFHNAGHRWLLKAIDDGLVPVAAIRNGPIATLMLRTARSRPRLVPEPGNIEAVPWRFSEARSGEVMGSGSGL